MTKTKIIYNLMYRLSQGEKLSVNTLLADEFDISTKTLRRHLDEIREDYSDIVTVEKKSSANHQRKSYIYRAINPREDLATTLKFFLENRTDLGWVLQLLQEKDSTLATDGKYSEEIKKLISQESDVFIFKSTPFEILDSKHQKIFSQLKSAIKNSLYRTIIYNYMSKEVLIDTKCLKLIFTQNNWYLAIEDSNETFRLLRVSFIDEIKLSSDKSSYHKSKLEKYEKHYQNIQNAMTLYNKPIQKALCKASPRVAIYFKEHMKPFFSSQRYIKINSDGSLEFELSYTQPIEILPFIKQWLPDIKVLEPSSLVDVLKQDILKASQDYIDKGQ